MWTDPIVEEIRTHSAKLAAQFNYESMLWANIIKNNSAYKIAPWSLDHRGIVSRCQRQILQYQKWRKRLDLKPVICVG